MAMEALVGIIQILQISCSCSGWIYMALNYGQLTLVAVEDCKVLWCHLLYDRGEPVEFEKKLSEVEDCKKITDRFRGIYRIYPDLIKENRRMSTCDRLDLQTLGSQPVMPKNLPNHCTCYLHFRVMMYTN
jgi:hypothetical protein